MGYRLPAFFASLLIHGMVLCFLKFPSAGPSPPGKGRPAAVSVLLTGNPAGFPGFQNRESRPSGEVPVDPAGKNPPAEGGIGVDRRMQAAETAQADRGVRTNSSAQADGGVQTNGGADELRRLLYSLIEKRLAYPPPAQERGIQGTVALVLQIGPEGQLLYSGVSHSSGSAVLDRAAGNVIAGIFPLEGIRMDKIEVITINVDYRLQ